MFFSGDQIKINKLEKLIDLKELPIPMVFEIMPQIDWFFELLFNKLTHNSIFQLIFNNNNNPPSETSSRKKIMAHLPAKIRLLTKLYFWFSQSVYNHLSIGDRISRI